MDKLLVAEMPPLFVEADNSGGWTFASGIITDYKALNTQTFAFESSIDLTGYVLQDMTTYFRQSFEQLGGGETITWTLGSKPLEGFNGVTVEYTIVTTVPMTDANLLALANNSPGFIPPYDTGGGNFNRDHIVHGKYCVKAADTTLSASGFDADGSAYVRIVQENDFSSLEPVAVDRLYVYRVLFLPTSFTLAGVTKLSAANLPSKRVILDAVMAKEEDIPYLMRLKRGYELANQV